MREFTFHLIERLIDSEQVFSRNRHFYTFANPQGRRALKVSRHLLSLARDIVRASDSGAPIHVEQTADRTGGVRLRLEDRALKARRTAFLTREEFELLLRTDAGVRRALNRAA